MVKLTVPLVLVVLRVTELLVAAHVGESTAPVGDCVSAQLSVTVPA
jgi:hypothetical protein